MSNLKSTSEVTTKGLLSHLFDQMHKLNANLINVDEAKAQALLTKQANNVLKYELDRASLIAKYEDKINIREIEDSH